MTQNYYTGAFAVSDADREYSDTAGLLDGLVADWDSPTSVGRRAAAVGPRALAFGTDSVGIACRCGLELTGRAAPGKSNIDAAAFFRDHATRCEQARAFIEAAG